MTASKIVAAAASGVGGAGLDVDEVFSTFLYEGNNSTQTITNNIDLSGEGGLVWVKDRTQNEGHRLIDTARGNTKMLRSDATGGNYTLDGGFNDFTSTGFTLKADGGWSINGSSADYVSWTFRKAKKFFDVVTWSGNGVNGRTISHNLGSVPGMILVKRTDSADGWITYHRGMDASSPEDYAMFLNLTGGRATETYWNNTAPTSTGFTVSSNVKLNGSSGTYVAYLFAHNDSGDGEFGPDSDQDIIKCGSYAGNGSDARTIDLGFEAQWVLVKRSDGATDWWILDSMRGLHARQLASNYLEANTSNAEASQGNFFADSQGFMVDAGDYNSSGENYIYMAIRKGPLAVPEDATKVFAIDGETDTSPTPPTYNSGFPVDLFLGRRNVSSADSWYVFDRLRGNTQGLITNTTDAEQNLGGSVYALDRNDGVGTYTGTSYPNAYGWMWKRAPGYFDVCCYIGNDTAGRTVSHNLGAVPEMMWVKRRDVARPWFVYNKDLDASNPSHKYLKLNETEALSDDVSIWNDTAPTSSVFTVGDSNNVNSNNSTYIAYLFATVAGVSKVGSFVGNGNNGRVIDCGFSSGARFILIKGATNTENWYVFDTVRGIVAGNDARLQLDNTSAEFSNLDLVDPSSSGFIVNSGGEVNTSGVTYIFYAIA